VTDLERPLADPATPLGMIERGRGAGFLWAREHPAEARPFLRACLERDPRWDAQIESRAAYYLEMAQAIGFGATDLATLLPATSSGDLPVAVAVGLALAGDLAARALVVEHVRHGAIWLAILHELGWVAAPQPAWPELPEAVHARAGDADDRAALVEELPYYFPKLAEWPEWRAHPELVALAVEALAARVDEPALGAYSSTQELLADGGVESASILAERTDEATVAALHTALREGGRASPAAWRALAAQGDTSAIALALEQLKDRQSGSGQRFYLAALPVETLLPLARELAGSSGDRETAVGWILLARHGAAEDVPMLYAELVSALSHDDFRQVGTVLGGLVRHPECGPYPVARTCFETVPYTYARVRAARLLSLTDPRGFADELAFECLWDCEAETRELAADLIAPATSEIRDRVATIAAART
jgi:hypothetical protein